MSTYAAGLPCISNDNGGTGDVVIDGVTGYLVPVGDDEAMANRLKALLQDDALRKKNAPSRQGTSPE